LVYIGTPDNEQFVGPQDPQKLAEHIHKSEGPSGLNKEYLWNLEIALDELSAESGDDHIKDLSERARLIEEQIRNQDLKQNGHVHADKQDKDRLEEVEK
jgi:cation transport protein ChaC